jgi:hypothetical protein
MKELTMRKAYLVGVVAAAILSISWPRASRTARQDCCHPSAAYENFHRGWQNEIRNEARGKAVRRFSEAPYSG